MKAGDTLTGALNMSGNAITGLPPPLNAPDAASKNYVDAIISASASTKLSTHGGALSGNLSMRGTNKVTDMSDPTADQDAATKAYVDLIMTDHNCDVYTCRVTLHSSLAHELPLAAMWPPRFSSLSLASNAKIVLKPGHWELCVSGGSIGMSVRLGLKMLVDPIETLCAHDVDNFFDFRTCVSVDGDRELKLEAMKEYGKAGDIKLCLKVTRL